ncbi:hypothetical protein [uncultured Chryseobacterium sp.]|uniref:hypothetical protein n=1 Tax=uncultured Chryseobacterium sp. TaxID=259322 RepID=UPI00374A01ED
MTKKMISWLACMAVFLFTLYSCVHDEMSSSSQPVSNEYTNLSLWKQDEKYIKNVMKIYAGNEEEIRKSGGIPLWNYATTAESFDESFVAVPIVSNGKVTSVLKVPRHGRKVYFYYTNNPQDIGFFQGLVFARTKKAAIADASYAQSERTSCTRQSISIWIPNDESNPDPSSGSGHWSTISYIKCVQLADNCIGVVNANGVCEGGSGTGGYDYPGGGDEGNNEEEEKDPCDEIKTKLTNPEFKQKLQDLNNPANFALDHEEGFFEKNGQFFPAASDACSYELKATTNVQCITGVMHTHPNADCEGNLKDKTPSPGDIAVFLNVIVPQAQSCLGNMQDAYSITVTPWGNYMLKYNNNSPPTNTSFDMETLFKIFDRELQKLTDKDLYTSDNVEKTFMKFIEDYMNVAGLEVYKVTESSSEKMEYNPATGTTTKTPCPNF